METIGRIDEWSSLSPDGWVRGQALDSTLTLKNLPF